MQTNHLLKKGLVIGIIVLLGVNFAPLAGSSSLGNSITRDILDPTSRSDSRGLNITLTGTRGLNGWYVSQVLVTFTCPEGASTIYYSINNGSWTALTANPIVFTIDGLYTVSAYCIYNNGSQSPIVSVSFKIDATPPEITKTVEKIGFREWRVTVTCTDATSGIGSVQVWFNNVLEANVTHPPFLLIFDWKYRPLPQRQITVIAFDDAGNKIGTQINPTTSIVKACPARNNIGSSSCQQYLLQQNSTFLQNPILRQQTTNR